MSQASLQEQLRENWPDAARLIAAAMIAYAIAHVLALREAHWAVLTALVTARGHAGGTARAGVERLVATIAGAALATAAAYARHTWQVNDALILFVALAPLCLLVAVRSNYRTAPVAALIVLSSGPAAGMGALGTALLRTTEIAVGAFASVLVSASVFPSRGRVRAKAHAAATLRLLAQWLRAISGSDAAIEYRGESLREAIRHEVRELTILAHTSGWRKMQDQETARLLRAVSALNGDTGFLARAVARKPLDAIVAPLREPFAAVINALIAALEQTATALATNAPPPPRDAIDAALKDLAAAARDAGEQVEPRHAQVLVYLLRALSMDLGHLATMTVSHDAENGKA